jgi:hypothetical protein
MSLASEFVKRFAAARYEELPPKTTHLTLHAQIDYNGYLILQGDCLAPADALELGRWIVKMYEEKEQLQ